MIGEMRDTRASYNRDVTKNLPKDEQDLVPWVCEVMKCARYERIAAGELSDLALNAFKKMGSSKAKKAIASLNQDDWYKLVTSPGNKVTRQVFGLARGTPPPLTHALNDNSLNAHSDALRGRWQTVKDTLLSEEETFVRRKIEYAQGLESDSLKTEDAAQAYLDAAAVARELENDGEFSEAFIKSNNKFLACALKLDKETPNSVWLRAETVRILAKILRSQPAYTKSDGLEGRIKPEVAAILENPRIFALIAQCCRDIDSKAMSESDSSRHLLTIWREVIRIEKNWNSIQKETYEAREQVNYWMEAKRGAVSLSFNMPIFPTFNLETPIEDAYVIKVEDDIDPLSEGDLLWGFATGVSQGRGRNAASSEGMVKASTALLVGPPGTSKSTSVKRLARHLNLPLVGFSGADCRNKWYGESAQNLEVLLAKCKARARRDKQAALIVLIEEIDDLGASRAGGRGSSSRADLDLLLVLRDRISPEQRKYEYTDENGERRIGELVVVATTNMPDDLDKDLVELFGYTFNFPRWTAKKNFEVFISSLSSRLSQIKSESTRQACEIAFRTLIKPDEWRNSLISDIVSFSLSRCDLRAFGVILDAFYVALGTQEGLDAKAVTWLLVRTIRDIRSMEHGNKYSVRTNAKYSFASELVCPEQGHTRATTVTSCRISLDSLLEKDEINLSLASHPAVRFLNFEQISAMLVICPERITIYLLEDQRKRQRLGVRLLRLLGDRNPEYAMEALRSERYNGAESYLSSNKEIASCDVEKIARKSIFLEDVFQNEPLPNDDYAICRTFELAKIGSASDFASLADSLTQQRRGKKRFGLELLYVKESGDASLDDKRTS